MQKESICKTCNRPTNAFSYPILEVFILLTVECLNRLFTLLLYNTYTYICTSIYSHMYILTFNFMNPAFFCNLGYKLYLVWGGGGNKIDYMFLLIIKYFCIGTFPLWMKINGIVNEIFAQDVKLWMKKKITKNIGIQRKREVIQFF